MKDNIRLNVIVNIIRTLALTLLSFLTFPYICRVLGDETLGLYTWCNTFVYYFLILAKVGIPNLALRECVKVRNDKEKLSNVVQTFFIIQSVTTILSFSLMSGLVFSINDLFSHKDIIFLLSINFVSGAFSFEWLYIALEKQFYMSVRSIIILALSALMIITMVTNKDDVYLYALFTAGVTVITTIVNIFFVSKYVSFRKTMPYDFKKYFRPLAILFSLSLVLAIYNQTDEFILGLVNKTKEQVGSYSVGVKGVDIIIGIIANLSTVFVPRSNYYYQLEDKRYFKNLTRYSVNICLFITLPAVVTMMVLSNQICSLISGNADITKGQFLESATILMILASMMVTYSLSDIIYGQILLPMKKEKYYLFAILGGAFLDIVLSLIFAFTIFKNTPSVGVAIATFISDFLILIFMVFVSWTYIKKALFSLNNLKLLFANILILFVSLFLVYWLPIDNIWKNSLAVEMSLFIELIVVTLIDAIVYIVSLLILKEDLVYSFISRKPKSI